MKHSAKTAPLIFSHRVAHSRREALRMRRTALLRWSFGVVGCASFAFSSLSSAWGDIDVTSGFTQVSTNACVNSGACNPKADSSDIPLGPHVLPPLSSSSSTSQGSSSATAMISTDATIDPSTGILEFTGTVSGNGTASINDNSITAAGNGTAGAQLNGQFTADTVYNFTVSGTLSVTNDSGIPDSRNSCSVKISGDGTGTFQKTQQGTGSMPLSGSGTLTGG